MIYILRLKDCKVGDIFVVKARSKKEAVLKINKEPLASDYPYSTSDFIIKDSFKSEDGFINSDFYEWFMNEEMASSSLDSEDFLKHKSISGLGTSKFFLSPITGELSKRVPTLEALEEIRSGRCVTFGH